MAHPELHELPPYLVAGNRFGSYGFGAGLSGLLLAIAPIGHAVAWVLVVPALVLGIRGLVRYVEGTATNRDTSAVGLIMGFVAFLVLSVETSVALNVALDYYGP
jgi:hypothetical protein